MAGASKMAIPTPATRAQVRGKANRRSADFKLIGSFIRQTSLRASFTFLGVYRRGMKESIRFNAFHHRPAGVAQGAPGADSTAAADGSVETTSSFASSTSASESATKLTVQSTPSLSS